MDSNQEFQWTDKEKKEIEAHIAKYPDPKSAVMPALWIAQKKWGWLPKGAMELVADTLKISYAHVFGVASFYTMYYKAEVPRHVFDICTCFTCGELGGQQVYEHTKSYLKCDKRGYSEDGLFFVRHAECLGACDTGPVMQITNGHYVHYLNKDKIEKVVQEMREGKMPEFKSIPLRDQSVLGPA